MIKTGVLKKIIVQEKIEISVVGGEDSKEITGDKFYIDGFKELLEGDEPVLVAFDSETNKIVEDVEGVVF